MAKKKQQKSFPNRPPDIVASAFNLWAVREDEMEEAKAKPAAIEVYSDKGEKFHEIRSYDGRFGGYALFVISKINPAGQITAVIRLKKDKVAVIDAGPKEFSAEEYKAMLEQLESSELAVAFDMANPQITPGRLLNLYAEGEGEK